MKHENYNVQKNKNNQRISMEQFSSVQSLCCVWCFATPWTTARQASLSVTNSWSLLKLVSMNQWCHPTISSSVVPFSSAFNLSFQMSQFFASGGQSIRASASASVLPVNIQDWFPLGWTGWISLQFKEQFMMMPKNNKQFFYQNVT